MSIAKMEQDRLWIPGIGKAAQAVKQRVQKVAQDVHASISPESPLNNGSRSPAGDVPHEARQWMGFESADFLEQGLSPGHTSHYIQAPNDVAVEKRLVIHRSQDGLQIRLASENDETLLVAKPNADGCHFDIFIGDGETIASTEPAFTLQGNVAKDRWTLQSTRCDHCESRGKRTCGTRELARMEHYIEMVGEGQAFCMDLDVPDAYDDGSLALLCPACNQYAQPTTRLSTRRPKWNPKRKSLTLDFHGRCSMASAQNFQIEAPNAPPGHVKMLVGKVGTHRYSLDYRHPLTTVQAFGAALTASHWV